MRIFVNGVTLVVAVIFMNQSNGEVNQYNLDTQPALDFIKPLESLTQKSWREVLPSVGSQGMYLDKMQVHRPGSKSIDAFGKSSHDDFVIIRNVPDELFKKAGKPYFWGMISNLKNRPFVAVRFNVQRQDANGTWKNISKQPYSIALSYITYEVTRTDFGKSLEKGMQKIANKGRTDIRDTRTYYAWVTSGGDGAYYLGKYEVRTTDATPQDMADIAKLIAKGSIERIVTIPAKGNVKEHKEHVKIVLAL